MTRNVNVNKVVTNMMRPQPTVKVFFLTLRGGGSTVERAHLSSQRHESTWCSFAVCLRVHCLMSLGRFNFSASSLGVRETTGNEGKGQRSVRGGWGEIFVEAKSRAQRALVVEGARVEMY